MPQAAERPIPAHAARRPAAGAAAAWGFLTASPASPTPPGFLAARRRPLVRAAVLGVVVVAARLLGANTPALVAAVAAVVTLTLALALPAPARDGMERFFDGLARRVALVAGTVLMGAAFVLVIVPFGLLRRRGRPDPLARRPDRAAESYWSAPGPKSSPERLF